MAEPTIDDLYVEDRTFPPSTDIRRSAHIVDRTFHDAAERDRYRFWADRASELIDWFEPWHTICTWSEPNVRWFEGARLNASYNCVDRHVHQGNGDRVAFHWEGEPGDKRTITYSELLTEIQRFAGALKAMGVGKGDRVNIYLGMVPELPIAMLACARLGAVHSVVFGGFSAENNGVHGA